MSDSTRSRWWLIAWALLPFLAALGGAAFPPDAWFVALVKPTWQPPSWLFGPVWSALYLMMGIAAGLVWLRGPCLREKAALAAFLIQLGLNALWTPVFFGLHAPGIALAIIALMWVSILITMLRFSRVSAVSAWLLAPYLAWVSFATALNGEIWRLNP